MFSHFRKMYRSGVIMFFTRCVNLDFFFHRQMLSREYVFIWNNKYLYIIIYIKRWQRSCIHYTFKRDNKMLFCLYLCLWVSKMLLIRRQNVFNFMWRVSKENVSQLIIATYYYQKSFLFVVLSPIDDYRAKKRFCYSYHNW